jgi:DNA-binding beta-propeller fold protein YncE
MHRFVFASIIAASLGACAQGGAVASAADEAASPLKPTLFVANKFGNTLSKIDLETSEEVLRLDSCTNPHELATSPDGAHVALACYGGTTVDIFRTSDLMRVQSIDLRDGKSCGGPFIERCPDRTEARPHGIVWHQSGTLYVTAEARQSIFVLRDPIEGPVGINEYPTGQLGSHMLAVAPDQSTAWTTDLGSRTVTRIDLKGGAEPISVTVGEEPEGIALSPDGSALWVSARGSNEAYELDPVSMEVRKTVSTGAFPLRIAIRPQGDVAVTSDLQDGGLSVIDLASGTVLRQIAVSSPKEAEDRFQVTILWSDDGSKIYVAETASDTVAEVDYASGQVLRRFKVGDGGDGMAILP